MDNVFRYSFSAAVIIGSWLLAWNGEIIAASILFYGYFIAFMLFIFQKSQRVSKRFKLEGVRRQSMRPFVILLIFQSLFFGPALYQEVSGWTPTKDDLATYDRLAPDMCPDYFASSGWERYVQRRNTAWCKLYPQYDPANKAAEIDAKATTASTSAEAPASSGDLWQ